jgi:cytochrome c oxidase subunit 4
MAHTDTGTSQGTIDHGHHVATVPFYLLIFGALIVGTLLTVVVAAFDLGPFNNIVMLAVACAKALLVVLYFMHVRWSTRLTWVVAASGFFWLLILFALTMQDYMTRGWIAGTLR